MLKTLSRYFATLGLMCCLLAPSAQAQFGSRFSGGNSSLGGVIGSAIRNASPLGNQGGARNVRSPFNGYPILTPPTPRMVVLSPPIGIGMRRNNSPGNVVGRAVVQSAVESINRSFAPHQTTPPPSTPPANRKQCPVPVDSTIVMGAPSTSAQVIHGPHSTTIIAETPVTAADTIVAAPGPGADDPQQQLMRLIEVAKTQFRAKQYAETIKTLDGAVQLAPENSDILQFRGFAYFAKNDFEEAAADVYDALLLGNTWNWNAVKDLYQSKQVYENHLRTLEAVRKAAPNMTHHFLLGYQYLVLEHLDRGQKELERALRAQPGEPLVTQLVNVVQEIRSKE